MRLAANKLGTATASERAHWAPPEVRPNKGLRLGLTGILMALLSTCSHRAVVPGRKCDGQAVWG